MLLYRLCVLHMGFSLRVRPGYPVRYGIFSQVVLSQPAFFSLVRCDMEEKKTYLDQNRAPIYEALQRFREMRVVPFDVPGHKHGRGNPELTAFLGQQCVAVDVNSMKPAPGQPVPSHFRYSGGGGAGGGGLRRCLRLFDGGRYHQFRAEHGAVHLQAGG